MSGKVLAPKVTGLTPEELLAVETLYRAFSEGNTGLLDQALSPDWQDIPLAPHQQPGRAGMKPLIEAFLAAFPDMRIIIHEVIGALGRQAATLAQAGVILDPVRATMPCCRT